MSSSSSLRSTSTEFSPRPYMEFMQLDEGWLLAPLPDVRKDAVELKKVYEESGSSTPHPLSLNMRFISIFQFSLFVMVTDVPEDLRSSVILTLKLLVQLFTEASEYEIRQLGWYPPDGPVAFAHFTNLHNARHKLVQLLMVPEVNKYAEALPYAKDLVRAAVEMLVRMGKSGDPVMLQPLSFVEYADVLVYNREFTIGTKKILEKLANAGESALGNTFDFNKIIFFARCHLALVLKEMDVEARNQKEHTRHCSEYLRKRPDWLPQAEIAQTLQVPGHPVLEALGGQSWLDNLPTTAQENRERMVKKCRQCRIGEPQKTLSACSGCKQVYYCGRECQKLNWKLHKPFCSTYDGQKEHLASLPRSEVKKQQNFVKWRKAWDQSMTRTFSSALGLHKDPSRGFTHLVIQEIVYTPNTSGEAKTQFRTSRIGVFAINDVLRDIETLEGMQRGDARLVVDLYIKETMATDNLMKRDKTPVLNYTFERLENGQVQGWLASASIYLDTLRKRPYEPDWRTMLNIGFPAPGPMTVPSGARDAELPVPAPSTSSMGLVPRFSALTV